MKKSLFLNLKKVLLIAICFVGLFSTNVYATSGIITGNDEVRHVDDNRRYWHYSDGAHDATCTISSGNWEITSSTTMTFKVEFNNRFGINYPNIGGISGNQSMGYIDLYYKNSVSSTTTYSKRVLYLLTADNQHETGAVMQIMGVGQGTLYTKRNTYGYSATKTASLSSLAGKIITSVKLHADRNASKPYCDRIRISGVDFNNVEAACSLVDNVSLTVSSKPTCSNLSAGAITIKKSGAISGKSYKVTYKYNNGSNQTTTITANSSGYLVMNGLKAGIYKIVTITDSSNSKCSISLSESITIDAPDCCSLVDDITLKVTSDPICSNLSAGEITILNSGAISGKTYSITYHYNGGSGISVNIIADSNGNLVMTGLKAGTYKIVTIKNTSGAICSSSPSKSITINAPDCTDTDGDGLIDTIDKDDDNDGILDKDEQKVIVVPDTYGSGAIVVAGNVGGIIKANGKPDGSSSVMMGNGVASIYLPSTLNAGDVVVLTLGRNNTNSTQVKVTDDASNNSTTIGLTKTKKVLSEYNYKITQNGTKKLTFTRLSGVVLVDGITVYGSGSSVSDIDTDGDGIIDRLDTDSDGDGCPDAIEGVEGGAISFSDLILSGTHKWQIDVFNLAAPDNGIDTDGVPNLVNKDGTADGTNDNQGQATTAAVTNSNVNSACVNSVDTTIIVKKTCGSINGTQNATFSAVGDTIVFVIEFYNGSSNAINNITVKDNKTGDSWYITSLPSHATWSQKTSPYVTTVSDFNDKYVLNVAEFKNSFGVVVASANCLVYYKAKTLSSTQESEDETPIVTTMSATESSLAIGPNPTEGKVTVEFVSAYEGDVNISVVSLFGGQQVLSKVCKANEQLSLDLSNQTKGIYLVVCKYGENEIIKKLIVK